MTKCGPKPKVRQAYDRTAAMYDRASQFQNVILHRLVHAAEMATLMAAVRSVLAERAGAL